MYRRLRVRIPVGLASDVHVKSMSTQRGKAALEALFSFKSRHITKSHRIQRSY